MKRILVVGITKNLGGIEKFLLSYCKNISNKNISIDFFANENECSIEKYIVDNKMKIVYFKHRYKKNPILFKKEFKKMLQENQYDIIWVNACSLTMLYYLKCAKDVGIKTRIMHSHNSKNSDGSLKGNLRQCIHLINKIKVKKIATHFWACSYEAAKFFYTKEILNNKLKIINNAIDLNSFKYEENIRKKYRKELMIEDNYVLGHVGRFNFQKNHMFLIKVFNEYLKLNSNSILLLIGEGEEMEKAKTLIESYGIQDKVRFLGLRNDISNIMQAIDLFVLPSLFEGLPIVGIEAQASGLPCVFSDKITTEVSLSEFVSFIPINSIKAWSTEIEKYSKMDINRHTLNKKLINNYDIFNESKKLEKIFENCS